MFKSNSSKFNGQSLTIPMLSLVCGTVGLLTPDWHQQLLAADGTANQNNVDNTIRKICPPQKGLGEQLQARCNALVTAGSPPNVLTQVTSEQTAAQNTQALEMNNNQLASLSNRISAIRSGRQTGRINIAGLMFDNNGNPVSSTQLAKLNDTFNKAAAGDDSFDRLGVFVNGDIGYGNRRTTTNEVGYNLNTHGVTAGVDYRFTDNFVLGTAFGYNNATSAYYSNLGKLETNSYSGAIYGSFFTESGFFIDGILAAVMSIMTATGKFNIACLARPS